MTEEAYDELAYMDKEYVKNCPTCEKLMLTEAEKHFKQCKYCFSEEREITVARAKKELKDEYHEALGRLNMLDEEIEDGAEY
ncbi:MAG: hypothetical protein KAR06_11145 [Deltaproteobacteria bacterium]|nr:hypothetical protein [Deltaproteobacteria bacterium]